MLLRGKYQKRRSGLGIGRLLCGLALAAALVRMAPEPAAADPPATAPLQTVLPSLQLGAPENGAPFPLLALADTRPAQPQPEAPEPVDFGIRTVTHNGGSLAAGAIYLANESSFDPDVDALARQDLPVTLSGSGVEVLILHTHGTEAYTPSDGLTYEASEEDRTLDPDRSVIRVGEELRLVLEARGIGVVHSVALHDYPAYSGSYDRSLADIESWVTRYPDLRIIIDLHRDSIVSASGTKYKAAAMIEGQSTAQLMFVAGTNGGGLRHDHWQNNLSLQLQLHDALNTRYPGLMRPMSIRNARFNQHVRTGSMLLEVGTSGNSLTEALHAVRLFGTVLADLLLET